jgi:hypothetical protein
MEKNEFFFEALPPERFHTGKRRKLLVSGSFLLIALIYLAVGIFDGSLKTIFGGFLFTSMFGIRFWDDYRIKPVIISCTPERLYMQQTEMDIEVYWNEVAKAVYNGRYLDLYGQSSIRYSFDLQPFEKEDRTSILSAVAAYLSTFGMQIKYIGKSAAVV